MLSFLTWIFIIILLSIFFYYIVYRNISQLKGSQKNKTKIPKIKAYIINMDKNKDRMEKVIKNYENSDLKEIPYERFPAVIGKNIDINEWLTEDAIIELKQVENKKYRNHHYQLTRGAIGCFLSHYALAKRLLEDDKYDYYFNLEDDIYITNGAYKYIQDALKQAPKDWDFILFGYNRLLYSNFVNKDFAKVTGFWGTHGMLMNKKGAKAFIDEVDKNKMDGQIDAYMSRMSQQGKLELYAYRHRIFHTYTDLSSDIQAAIKPKKGVDPFEFRGYNV